MESITAKEIAQQVERYIIERGQSNKSLENYHYILSVFIQYCDLKNNGYFTEEIGKMCVSEHYKIPDITIPIDRKEKRKRTVVRVYHMMMSVYKDEDIKNRYLSNRTVYELEPCFNKALTDFELTYQKYDYSPKTIGAYKKTANKFLVYASQHGYTDFNVFSAQLVMDFMQSLIGYTKITIRHSLSELRIFLKFLHTEGYIPVYLDDVFKPLKTRSQLRIPSVWRKEEVLKMLSAIDRDNPSGKRDYAMILLVTRLGLRISDVNKLKFDNIDWKKKSINIIQHKTNEPLNVPLLNDIGWALIDYIKNGRPSIETDCIFVTHVPPFKEFSMDNHHHKMIEKYMRWAGISVAEKRKLGMHSLRHTLATVMLENHEDYHNISAIIGHSSVDSTQVYLKTSVELLRECTLPMPEVKSDVSL